MQAKEDEELRPLDEKYEEVMQELRLAKKELRAYKNIKEENEGELYLKEAKRLQKEAEGYVEFLGNEDNLYKEDM